MERAEKVLSSGVVGEEVYRGLRNNLPLALLVGGYGMLSFAFNWGLGHAGSSAPWDIGAFSFRFYVEGGEIAGFGLAALAAVRRWSAARMGGSAGVCMAAGMLAMLAPWGFLGNIGSVAFGFGYAVLLTEYLTMASRLVPRKTLIVIATGLVSAFAVYPLLNDLNVMSGLIYSFVAVAVAMVCLLAVGGALPPLASDSKGAAFDVLKGHKRLVAFAIGVPFAYGFCTSYLALGPSSFGFALGYMIPGAMVLAGLALFYNRFSLATVYIIGYPTMILGLLLSFFLGLPTVWSKALISASLSSVYILTYMMARLYCRSASAFRCSYAMLTLLITFFVTAGKEAGSVFVPLGLDSAVAVALIMVAVLSFGLVMPRIQEGAAPDVRDPRFAASLRRDALALAHEHGLSERETAVYVLLVSDKSVSDISEELFIASSTVRAHASRIYEKFGVHDRKGLKAVSR